MIDQPTKLFVYGIFLGAEMRAHYRMTNPEYTTVLDYVTYGHSIVKAVHVPDAGVALTGVMVNYDPTQWQSLDNLEGSYDRIIVETTRGEIAYMYAEHEEGVENHSTYVPHVYNANKTEVTPSER